MKISPSPDLNRTLNVACPHCRRPPGGCLRAPADVNRARLFAVEPRLTPPKVENWSVELGTSKSRHFSPEGEVLGSEARKCMGRVARSFLIEAESSRKLHTFIKGRSTRLLWPRFAVGIRLEQRVHNELHRVPGGTCVPIGANE